jgi:cytochrome P450
MQALYGDAVRLRLGPYRYWLLFNPAQIEAVLTSESVSFVRFEPMMRVLAQWNGQSLIVSEGERWRDRRRQVLPAFANRRFSGYGERIVARTGVMLDAWRAGTHDGIVSRDTDREMVSLTLEIAADTLFGEALGGRAAAAGAAVATLSDVAFRESTNPLQLPDWLPLPSKKRKRQAISTVKSLVGGIVTTRLTATEGDRGDLLSILIEAGDREPTAICDEVTTLLIAGHETTGAALSWASYLLAQHRDVLAEVRAEIDQAIADQPPRIDDLARMPTLRAAIDETLRLYPPAYALFPRRAIDKVALGDITIGKDDVVQIVPFATQRDRRWFPEPSAFRPARFRDTPTWPRYAYLPFGAGPRVCIGQGFGLMEMGLILATILQRFSPLPAREPVHPEPRFSLRPRDGLPQEWQLRSRITALSRSS